MALLAINANDIDTAGLPVDAALPVAWIDGELADAEVHAIADGHLSARLSRSDEDIVVRGRVKAELTAPCARCLDPAAFKVDAEISLLLHKAKGAGKRAAHADEREFSASDAEVDEYDGDTVLLDPFVREAMLLEVPNFPLCSEACPGIRPAASPEPEEVVTTDPRLAPLSALRDKLAKDSKAQAKTTKKAKG